MRPELANAAGSNQPGTQTADPSSESLHSLIDRHRRLTGAGEDGTPGCAPGDPTAFDGTAAQLMELIEQRAAALSKGTKAGGGTANVPRPTVTYRPLDTPTAAVPTPIRPPCGKRELVAADCGRVSAITVTREGSVVFSDGLTIRSLVKRPGSGPYAKALVAGCGAQGIVDGPGSWAQFGGIAALAVDDDGAIIAADREGHRVCCVSSGLVRTVLEGSHVLGRGHGPFGGPSVGHGTKAGESRFAPQGVALRPDGTILVADSQNHRIRSITPSGLVTVVAGPMYSLSSFGSGAGGFADGAAAGSRFLEPGGLAICIDGAVLVCDTGNHRIRLLSADGTSVSTLCGTGHRGHKDGAAGVATFDRPESVAVDNRHPNTRAVIGERGGLIRIVDLSVGVVLTPDLGPDPRSPVGVAATRRRRGVISKKLRGAGGRGAEVGVFSAPPAMADVAGTGPDEALITDDPAPEVSIDLDGSLLIGDPLAGTIFRATGLGLAPGVSAAWSFKGLKR